MVAHGVSRGFAVKNSKPRTGDTILVTQRFVFRPSGACSFLFALPTVETVGYFLPPLRGCAPPETQKPVERLVDRILAAKAWDASADAGLRSEEIGRAHV